MRILETAALGPTGQLLGATITGQQFLGARFHVARRVRVTAVGGHLAADFPETLFAAIVRLPSATGLPAFPPRSIESSALASTLFTPPRPSQDLLTPLSVQLAAGHYALVLGGADSAVGFFPFGAHGTGVMPVNNTGAPGASYLRGDVAGWVDDPALTGARFVVEGTFVRPKLPRPKPKRKPARAAKKRSPRPTRARAAKTRPRRRRR
jgi:hypothetical protein